MDYASTTSVRPDRPLTVKCAFDRSTRRIQFASARNCSATLLRAKVEECFSLAPGTFTVVYTDDDGETMDIVTDADLTEAILYFQSGVDDVPVSSAASYYSARSVGSRKITLRVHVQVDYDGPSLSDTASLVGLDEDPTLDQFDIQDVLSLNGSSLDMELEDDAVTISSKDTGPGRFLQPKIKSPSGSTGTSSPLTISRSIGNLSSEEGIGPSSKTVVAEPQRKTSINGLAKRRSPLSNDWSSEVREESDGHSISLSEDDDAERYPADPSAVFERLKYLELKSQSQSTSTPSMPSLAQVERGQRWLIEQSSRSTLAPLIGPGSEPSEPDVDNSQVEEVVDLALERDPRGHYYYTYTGGSSAPSQSHENASDYDEEKPLRRHASTSRSLGLPEKSEWVVVPETISEPPEFVDVPDELIPFIETPTPPDHIITDCSSCGQLLDSFRYVCCVCGEKKPCRSKEEAGKGKGKQRRPHAHIVNGQVSHFSYDEMSTGSSGSGGSGTGKPLPHPPTHSTSLPNMPHLSRLTAGSDSSSSANDGYELCMNCIHHMGIIHAVEGTVAPSPSSSSDGMQSPGGAATAEDVSNAISAMRRSAPRRKGLIRHAYMEKIWAGTQWTSVEQDLQPSCSICSSSISTVAFKCLGCQKFELCRACYSQVHEIHPSHAFLVISSSLEDFPPPTEQRTIVEPEIRDMDSMMHQGVKCAHCMLDIVGARFHCAICDSVDICANCESAGVGNLTSDDGGHDSSHIMIKIPYPIESAEVRGASRRAMHLWTGRDAPVISNKMMQRRTSISSGSDHGRTVVGTGTRNGERTHTGPMYVCRACGKNISGIRYQCATCPSLPTSYNLCQDCEPLSYVHHNPMHSFIKVLRPVDRPIESTFGILPSVYRTPAGIRPDGSRNLDEPRDYIRSLYHHSALCDICMERIRGEWFRCVYCSKDLCSDHEAMENRQSRHLFIVFKSNVDMGLYRNFTDIEQPENTPPLIPYPVYHNWSCKT